MTTSGGATISFGTGGPLDSVMTNPNNPSGGIGATLTIGSLTTANANTTPVTTFYGVLEDGTGGQLSLTKAGLGTQILAGQNTYSGPTIDDRRHAHWRIAWHAFVSLDRFALGREPP